MAAPACIIRISVGMYGIADSAAATGSCHTTDSTGVDQWNV